MRSHQSKLISSNKMINGKIQFKKLARVNNPHSVHGLYPYRGKISAIDARQVITQLPQEGTLLDPFCGSGTIVYEAQKWGLNSIGVDNNPIAVLLSKAKTQHIDPIKTINHCRTLIKKSKKVTTSQKMNKWSRRFFHEKSAEEIMNLLYFKKEMSCYERCAFYGAIALSARACNHYKWSSTSIGKVIEPKIYVNVYEKFLMKVKKHIQYVDGNNPGQIFQYDSRKLSEILDNNSIDFVYTSPPYFDALDYTGYYTRIIYELDDDFDRKEIRSSLTQSLSTYAKDMKEILSEIQRVCKVGATIIFVVGDKKTKGKVINGGEFFSELTEWKPSYIVEREYSGTSSQIWDSINKTKRKEQIVVWINQYE